MARITFVDPVSETELRNSLHPLVQEWFFMRFKAFSPTQLHAVTHIHHRKNVLVSAPTGGTKTLTAFLAIINYLVELATRNELEDKVYALYTSPLRALSNDIFVNLEQPLKEIKELAVKKNISLQEIRVGLRTGDTTPAQRAKMMRKTPHVLVTTPETLAILITTKVFMTKMAALEFLIVDEVHALANKRGTYLSLTLERLSELSIIDPVRIGLSATIAPLEEIASFLVGTERECAIAAVKLVKNVDVDLIVPGKDLIESETIESQRSLYRILNELIQNHKTTLIFTNTRNATERVIQQLHTHFPGQYVGVVGAHHSSMSKEQRFMIEERLRKGDLKVVVTSTSLELGIDIGSVDLVVLLRSPKGVARALQRIGRAGHRLHENPKGRFIVLDRDDLVECSVMMKHMLEKNIDRVDIPCRALDVLAQHIFGMAITRVWKANDMLKVLRKSYCYKDLSKEDFFAVISYLAGDYALENRHVYAKIWYDPKTGDIGKRGKLARVIYLTNVGTIAEEGFMDVIVGAGESKGGLVGSIDESFAERLKRGDVFVLGGIKYEFLFTRGMKVYVRGNVSKNPTVPSWFSEMLPLTYDLAIAIAKFRGLVQERLRKPIECISFIQEYLHCSKSVAGEIFLYVKEQEDFSQVPSDKVLLVEKFVSDKEYLLFHSMYGRRVNDALSRAYAFVAGSLRSRDIEIGINDNGFFIAGDKLQEDKILKGVTSKQLEPILKEAIEKTDVLKRRFRHCAGRSLMILRNYRGRTKSVGKQQVQSGFLLAAVRAISNEFPILREARREVFEDVMDVVRAKNLLESIERGAISVSIVRTPLVSPFGLTLILQSHTDLIKMEERATFLKRMHELHLHIIREKNKL
jgi:ATP-dependent Lhr-like helicase